MGTRNTLNVGRIVQIERANNSVNGNPAYWITFNNCGPYRSSSDAGWCYGVGNSDLREGSSVAFELTPAHRIAVVLSRSDLERSLAAVTGALEQSSAYNHRDAAVKRQARYATALQCLDLDFTSLDDLA